MVQRNNLQGHLGHDDNMIIRKGVDNRNINTASPEYIAFHSIQCRSRVTQIFFLFLFCFWTTRRREDHNQDLCWQRGNKKHTKNKTNAEWFIVQNQESAYVRSCREYTRRSSEACKKTKVAFRCRWFIAVYLVTSGVAFHLHRPVAPALTWTRKRPRRAPEFVPFRGLRGKRNSFAISILYVAIWGKSVKGKNKYFSIW